MQWSCFWFYDFPLHVLEMTFVAVQNHDQLHNLLFELFVPMHEEAHISKARDSSATYSWNVISELLFWQGIWLNIQQELAGNVRDLNEAGPTVWSCQWGALGRSCLADNIPKSIAKSDNLRCVVIRSFSSVQMVGHIFDELRSPVEFYMVKEAKVRIW